MNVHLVTIEIGVVRLAVGVVQSKRFLALQNLGLVRHYTRFVQRRLTVQQEKVSIAQMAMYLKIQ